MLYIGHSFPKYLNKDQLTLFTNEQLREQKLKEEYELIIGQITTSGIRELRKSLTKEEKKKFKIEKKTIKWRKEWAIINLIDHLIHRINHQQLGTLLEKVDQIIMVKKDK